MAKIATTKDFSRFKTVTGNRAVTETHVKRLMASIGRKNLLPFAPILVNENMEVIDGQHRLEAARLLGLEVTYITAPGARIKDVQLLNASQKQWTLEDYTNSYATQGYKDYQILKEFYQNQDIPVSIAVWLLTKDSWGGGHMMKFKEGGFVITSMEEAYEVADRIKMFQEHTTPQVRRSRGFIRALRTLHRNNKVNWEHMKEKLNIYAHQIPAYQSSKDYLRTLEDIYNFKAREVSRIY
jgi:hypothetical protein